MMMGLGISDRCVYATMEPSQNRPKADPLQFLSKQQCKHCSHAVQ